MSYIKRYLEDHINDYSDEELLNMGYSKEDIELLRDSFPNNKEQGA